MNPRHFTTKSVSRRAFLQTTGTAAAALCGLSAHTAENSPHKRKVVVGAHPWVYAATRPGYDIGPILPQIFADMKYADLDGIELMHNVLLADDAVARIGRLSKEHALPVIGTSFGGEMWNRDKHAAVMGEADKVIPRLAELGGRTLGISVGAVRWGSKTRKTPEQLDAQAELLAKIFALCKKHGVVPNLHNHTYEVENDLHDLKGTLERLPEAKLGPDLNWLVRGGVDPAAFIRDYGSKIVFLHLRDQYENGRWSEALGEGDMDYEAIAKALHEIKFQGDAVIELAHERDFKPTRPLKESLKMSRRFVRETMEC